MLHLAFVHGCITSPKRFLGHLLVFCDRTMGLSRIRKMLRQSTLMPLYGSSHHPRPIYTSFMASNIIHNSYLPLTARSRNLRTRLLDPQPATQTPSTNPNPIQKNGIATISIRDSYPSLRATKSPRRIPYPAIDEQASPEAATQED